jgi:hypothetical protein
MLSGLKVIFIHGINDTATNYSQGLYLKVLDACREKLSRKGLDSAQIDEVIQKVSHHEVFWANLTTDLTNRYLQLEYENKPNLFWRFLTRPVDPLGLQIMLYIKDKGDKKTGEMSILKTVDEEMQRILSADDVGKEVKLPQAQNVIIVAHSLGAVIGFDYVMGFRKEHQINQDVSVRSFITMGSPLPIFTSAMGHPDSDLVLPLHVKKWVNVLSLNDGLARHTKPFFKKIPIDEQYVSTGLFPIQAHLGYFKDRKTAGIIADEILNALGI